MGIQKAEEYLDSRKSDWEKVGIFPSIEIPYSHMVHERNATAAFGLTHWHIFFNHRHLVTLLTYVEIINEVKEKLFQEDNLERAEAVVTYLTLVLDRCVDLNNRLAIWNASQPPPSPSKASITHALNISWNYPETHGGTKLWQTNGSFRQETTQNYAAT